MAISWIRKLFSRPVRPLCRRPRLGFEELETRLAPATHMINSLEFSTSGNFANSPVQVGEVISGTFVPLLELQGGVSFGANDVFATSGEIDALLGSSQASLELLKPLTNGTSYSFNADSLLDGGLSLASLVSGGQSDATSVTVAGVNFALANLQLTHSGLELQGSVTLPQFAGLTVAVTGNDYVLITNTSSAPTLTGLDVSLGSTTQPLSTTIAGLDFSLTSLDVHYSHDTTTGDDTFQLSGAGSISLRGHTVGVSLGTETQPGIAVTRTGTNGAASLTSFDASFTTDLDVAGLDISANGLGLSYSNVNGATEWNAFGNASFSLDNNTVAVSLGTQSAPGLVIQNGDLSTLNMTVNGNITVGSLTFTASDLAIDYTAGATPSSDMLTITGAASVTLDGNSVGVNFIADQALGTNGLVIEGGALSSMDVEVTSSFSVGGLTFATDQTDGLTLVYVAPSSANNNQEQFDIRGGATVTLLGSTFSVDLPNDGIVINNGSLISLDVSLSGDLKVGGLDITANGLEVAYTAANNATSTPETLVITGGASLSVAGATIDVEFGGNGTQGLVLKGGTLSSLDMSVSADFTLLGLTFNVQNLTVDYVASPESLTLFGSVTVSTGGSSPTLDGLTASLGTASDPGLVLDESNGHLTVASANIGISGGFNLFGVNVVAQKLDLDYNAADNAFRFSGGLSISFTNSLSASAAISEGYLEINTQTGAVTLSSDFQLTASLTIGSYGIKDLTVGWDQTNSGLTINASGEVEFPGFEATGSLQIVNGQLNEIGFDVEDANIEVGDTGFFINQVGGEIDNIANPSNLDVNVTLGVSFGPGINVPLSSSPVYLLEGTVSADFTPDSITLSGTFEILGGLYGSGNGTATLNWQTGYFTVAANFSMYDDAVNFGGTLTIDSSGDLVISAYVNIEVPAAVPVIGGDSLGSGNLLFVYMKGDNADSYLAVWGHVPILGTVGFEIDFDGGFHFLNAKAVDNLEQNATLGRTITHSNGHYYEQVTITVPEGVTEADMDMSLPSSQLTGIIYYFPNQTVGSSDFEQVPGGNNSDFKFELNAANTGAVKYIPSGTYTFVVVTTEELSTAPDLSAVYHFGAPLIYDNQSESSQKGDDFHIVVNAQAFTPAALDTDPNGTSGTTTPTISFYYETASTVGYNGTLIGTINYNPSATAFEAAYSYDWYDGLLAAQADSSNSLQAYSVYAVINDGQNTPAYTPFLVVTPPQPGASINLPTTQVTPYTQDLTFSTANKNAITIGAGTGNSTETVTKVTVSVNAGTLSLTGYNTGQEIDLTGLTVAQYNQLLSRLTYNPNPEYHGGVSLTVTTTSSEEGINSDGTFDTIDPPYTYTRSAQLSIVEPNNDLSVSQNVDSSNPLPGSTVHYTVTVKNNPTTGGQNATNVVVTEPLPTGLTLVSASPGQGSYNPSTGVWSIGNLPLGASVTLTLTATVGGNAGGQTLATTANVSAALDDLNLTNNVSTATVVVRTPIVVTTLADISDTAAQNELSQSNALTQQIQAERQVISTQQAQAKFYTSIGQSASAAVAQAQVAVAQNELQGAQMQLNTIEQNTTLRLALLEAAAAPGTDLITFDVTGTISLLSTLNITSAVDIAGPGVQLLTLVAATSSYRALQIGSGKTVTLQGLSIGQGGILNDGTLSITAAHLQNSSYNNGGALDNHGTLQVAGSQFTGNSSNNGGAIDNEQGFTATIGTSSFESNTATMGGAVENQGTLAVTASTFSGNGTSTTQDGGAVNNTGSGNLTINESTFQGNQAHYGGAIASSGRASLVEDTVAGNAAVNQGGGFDVISGNGFTVADTIIATNTAPVSPDIYGHATSNGYNLIGNSSGSTGWIKTDLTGTNTTPLNPDLGPLQNNQGLTQTMLPLPGSPAVDAGPATSPFATDQRGLGRVVGSSSDIGAVEFQSGTMVRFTVGALPTTVTQGALVPVTVTAIDAYGHAAISGSLQFSSSDSNAVLPTGYAFNLSDQGTHTFYVQLNSLGAQSFTIALQRSTFTYTSPTISVVPQEITVTSTGDFSRGGNGTSLREAVYLANIAYGANTIVFNLPTGSIIALGSPLTLSDNVSIDGTGGIVLDGGDTQRLIQVNANVVATLANLTLQNADSAGDGGAILNNGALTLNNDRLSNDHAVDGGAVNNVGSLNISNTTFTHDGVHGNGGAIQNLGQLTVVDSDFAANQAQNGGGINDSNHATATITGTTFDSNSATNQGGAINGGADTLTLDRSTLSNNTATFGGGLDDGGNATSETSTFYGNTATRQGGAIFTSGIFALDHSTVAGNSAGSGGGLFVGTGASILSSIIAGNTATGTSKGADVSGHVISLGNNLVGKTDGGTGWINTDLTGTNAHPLNANLAPAAYNGGPTLTLLPNPGSPAVDHGSSTGAGATDQRGLTRTVGTVDIGAVEVQVGAAVGFTISVPASASVAAGSNVNVTVTAVDAYGHAVPGYTGTIRLTSGTASDRLSVTYTFQASNDGSEVFHFIPTLAGTHTLTVTSEAATPLSSATAAVTVVPGQVQSFTLTGMPTSVMAGTPVNLTLTAYDRFGNVATNFLGTVQIRSTDPQATGISSYTFTAADSGVHIFAVVLKTNGFQQVSFVDELLPTTPSVSATTTVTPAAATHLKLTVIGSSTNNAPFSLQVEALDAYGNVATGFTGAVRISSAALATTQPYTFSGTDQGVHTFSGLRVPASDQVFTLTARDGNIIGTITVNNRSAAL